MTRYYGHYSNKSRGMRAKAEAIMIENVDNEITSNEIEVIDISKYQPKNVPSLTWRECIKKIWKDDPPPAYLWASLKSRPQKGQIGELILKKDELISTPFSTHRL